MTQDEFNKAMNNQIIEAMKSGVENPNLNLKIEVESDEEAQHLWSNFMATSSVANYIKPRGIGAIH